MRILRMVLFCLFRPERTMCGTHMLQSRDDTPRNHRTQQARNMRILRMVLFCLFRPERTMCGTHMPL